MSKLKNAVFLGSKDLGLSILEALYSNSHDIKWTIIHPDDSKDARSNLKGFQSFARTYDLDMKVSSSAEMTKRMLADLRPDIGFVCGWYWLLDSEALSIVPEGLWGIHNSLLPKYRGGAPLVWSIINGDQVVGSSVFKISEGMDDGDILYQVSVENNEEDDVGSLLRKIEEKLLAQLPEKWGQLTSGIPSLSTQNEDEATYCGQRTEADGLIDWSKTASELYDFIRAQTRPYPCAFSYLNGKTVRFLKSRAHPGKYFGTPGQVLRVNDRSVIISCGSHTALEIIEIFVDGNTAPASSVLRSVQYRLG
jgi:methionyl-tRNA formyltransferase